LLNPGTTAAKGCPPPVSWGTNLSAIAPENEEDGVRFPLQRIKAHKRMMFLGKTFFQVDAVQKTNRNCRLPHPPMQYYQFFNNRNRISLK
jgi:hypothetical protein